VERGGIILTMDQIHLGLPIINRSNVDVQVFPDEVTDS